MTDFISIRMREKSQIWRIIVGLMIIGVIYIGAGLAIGVAVTTFVPDFSANDLLGTRPLSLMIMLATFIPVWFGVRFAMFWPMRQPIQALYTVTQRINWRDFGIGLSLSLIAVSIFEIASVLLLGTPQGYSAQFIADPATWLMLLIPASVLILFQAGAEEVLFRGYFLRLIWARGGRYWWAFFVPSFIFGLGHFAPDQFGSNAWFYVANTTVTGMILCAITVFRGNIGAAFGLHWGINLFGILILSNDGYLSGLALFLNSFDPADPQMGWAMVIMTLIEVVIYVVWAHRTYGKIVPT